MGRRLLLTFGLLSGLLLRAHTMDQIAILLDFRSDRVEVELQLPLARVRAALNTNFADETAARQEIAEYISPRISATLPDGRKIPAENVEVAGLTSVDGAPYILARLTLSPPSGTSLDLLELRSEVLLDPIRSQTALVSIRSDWRTATFADEPVLLGALGPTNRIITINRRDGSWRRGLQSVFLLGTRHIAEGTDHLLFLLALLLPAPIMAVGGRWARELGVRQCLWNITKVVTAFTIGHSITLAVGALDWIRVPAEPVEAVIAISILVSAVHAWRPLFPGREALIACGFGLIHGLAFATTLEELGLAPREKASAILAFNLGIEAMQLLVVAACMPSLILLSRTPFYAAIRVPGALFAAIASAGWIAERVAGLPNPFEAPVSALASQAWMIALALLTLSISAWWYHRWYRIGYTPASRSRTPSR